MLMDECKCTNVMHVHHTINSCSQPILCSWTMYLQYTAVNQWCVHTIKSPPTHCQRGYPPPPLLHFVTALVGGEQEPPTLPLVPAASSPSLPCLLLWSHYGCTTIEAFLCTQQTSLALSFSSYCLRVHAPVFLIATGWYHHPVNTVLRGGKGHTHSRKQVTNGTDVAIDQVDLWAQFSPADVSISSEYTYTSLVLFTVDTTEDKSIEMGKQLI